MVNESISFSPTSSLTHLSRSSRRSSLSMLKQSSSHGLDVGGSKLHPGALVTARGALDLRTGMAQVGGSHHSWVEVSCGRARPGSHRSVKARRSMGGCRSAQTFAPEKKDRWGIPSKGQRGISRWGCQSGHVHGGSTVVR
jgi:hypothetical protein